MSLYCLEHEQSDEAARMPDALIDAIKLGPPVATDAAKTLR